MNCSAARQGNTSNVMLRDTVLRKQQVTNSGPKIVLLQVSGATALVPQVETENNALTFIKTRRVLSNTASVSMQPLVDPAIGRLIFIRVLIPLRQSRYVTTSRNLNHISLKTLSVPKTRAFTK